MTVRWATLEREKPDLAAAGRNLLMARGEGFAFLSTVRKDGGPRVHPVTVIIGGGGIWAFLAPSPKERDIERDGRFALHSFPALEGHDEFYMSGRGRREDREEVRRAVADLLPFPFTRRWPLFELCPEVAMLATYTARGQWPPTITTWRS